MRDRSNFLVRVAYICQEHELTKEETKQVISDLDIVHVRKWATWHHRDKKYDEIVEHVFKKKEVNK